MLGMLRELASITAEKGQLLKAKVQLVDTSRTLLGVTRRLQVGIFPNNPLEKPEVMGYPARASC